jgi:hypothetical protein
MVRGEEQLYTKLLPHPHHQQKPLCKDTVASIYIHVKKEDNYVKVQYPTTLPNRHLCARISRPFHTNTE